MKTLKQFLSEKRRNPEQNPTTSAYEKLLKYRGNNNVFVSFTDINKIGINPTNNFNTPTAIYTYPLSQIWKDLDKNKKASSVPFAGKRKFIQVIEHSKNGKYIHDLATRYTESMFNKDMDILRKLYQNDKKSTAGKEEYENTFEKLKGKIDWLYIKIQRMEIYPDDHKTVSKNKIDNIFSTINSLYKLAKKDIDRGDYSFEWEGYVSTQLREIGYELDNLYDIVYNEGDMDTGAYDIIMESLRAMKKMSRKLRDGDGEGTVDWSIERGSSDSRDQSWGGKMWNVTRLIANGHKEYGSKKSVSKWNRILRVDLGYDGMADRSGKGIIHPAEPTQAIFLHRKGFNHLETILNKSHREVADIKTMDDVFDALEEKLQYSYKKNDRYHIVDLMGDMNQNIINVDRKKFLKILSDSLIKETDKWIDGTFQDNVVISWLLYHDKIKLLSNKSQTQKTIDNLVSSNASDPLRPFWGFGIKKGAASNKKMSTSLLKYYKLDVKEADDKINLGRIPAVFYYIKSQKLK